MNRDHSVLNGVNQMSWESYQRPPVNDLDPEEDGIIFQELELEHYIGHAYPRPQKGLVPIVLLFGVTDEGYSVCCHIHGFFPYFLVSLRHALKDRELNNVKKRLNNAVLADSGSKTVLEGCDILEPILTVEQVQGKPLVAKVTVAVPGLVVVAKRLIAKIVDQPYPYGQKDLDFETRFMTDTNVSGRWVQVPAGKWSRRTECVSRCQIEVDVIWPDVVVHEPIDDWLSVAKFRIHSLDIECAGRKDIFPDPTVDPVIQIANIVKLHGDEEVLYRNIFTLKSCAAIDKANIYCFDKEEEMLEAWSYFVRALDPDVFTGYNINSFDFPYLIDRAKVLKLEKFPYLGRLPDRPSFVTEKRTGRWINKYVHFAGRLPYDMFVVMRRDFSMERYTLGHVSHKILNERKDDVHYDQITPLQNGDEKTRRRLAVYCLKDAELPLKLLNRLLSFEKDIKLARKSGVPIKSLLTREGVPVTGKKRKRL